MEREKFRAYFAWATICIVWGTTYLAIRVGVSDLPPMLFAGVRWLAAFSILFPILKLRGYKLPQKDDLLILAVIGLLLLGIANGLVVVAMQWLPSGLSALLITTMPFWVVIFESFLPKGPKPNIMIIGGLILGFGGAALVVNGEMNFASDTTFFIGIICLMLAVMSWAGGSLISKYKKVKVDPLMGAAFQMLTAGIAQTTLGLILGELPYFTFPSNESIIAFVYLAIFGAIFGYVSYIYAINHLPVSFVATYAYINPIIALFLGWIVLDEELNWMILLSAAIIITGVILVKKGSEKANFKI